MTHLAHVPSCSNCLRAENQMRNTCFWCGSALHVGRMPSPVERQETSREARMQRQAAAAAARRTRTPAELDALVLAHIRATYGAYAEFTHDQIVAKTNIKACGVKHSLDRLATQHVVAPVGRIRIKWDRYHTVWQVLPGTANHRSSSAEAKRRSMATTESSAKSPASVK